MDVRGEGISEREMEEKFTRNHVGPMTMNFGGRRIHGLHACGASVDAKPSATMEIMFA